MSVDYVANMAVKAGARVRRGYYDDTRTGNRPKQSLVETIQKLDRTPVITEIKFASPSAGKIRETQDPVKIALEMLKGGACAISVVTDPDDFHGSLDTLVDLSRAVDAPLIMKDIFVSSIQVQAAATAGARAVVLISELFSRGLTDEPLRILVQEANQLGVEVILEANSPLEFGKLRAHRPDLYGVNNRNLTTFKVDLSTTERVLALHDQFDHPVVSESGIEYARDIARLKKAGANAFLVGTSIMKSSNIESKVRELVNA